MTIAFPAYLSQLIFSKVFNFFYFSVFLIQAVVPDGYVIYNIHDFISRGLYTFFKK